MGLPKNKKNINVYPNKTYDDRTDEIVDMSDLKTTYLPQSIHIEDLEMAFFEFIKDGDCKTYIDGLEVPSFFLTNERWAEFSKTWKYVDNNKNIAPPFLTVRRTDLRQGSKIVENYATIPQNKQFQYLKVPIFESGKIGADIYKIPQPIQVDLVYEVKVFLSKTVHANLFDEKYLKVFSNRQKYIMVKGHYIPLFINGMKNEDNVDNIDDVRYYVKNYEITLKGYLQDSKDFTIVPTINRTLGISEIE